jgi:hypothetical protein
VLNEPLAGVLRISAPPQLRMEQVEKGAADLADLQVPERRLDNPPGVSVIRLSRRQVPVGHLGVLCHELGHGRVRLGLASRRGLLEQLAELDLRRPFGLAGLRRRISRLCRSNTRLRG